VPDRQNYSQLTGAFENYTEAFKAYNYKRYFMNSVIVTTVATVVDIDN